jgi:hypothetical protein
MRCVKISVLMVALFGLAIFSVSGCNKKEEPEETDQTESGDEDSGDEEDEGESDDTTPPAALANFTASAGTGYGLIDVSLYWPEDTSDYALVKVFYHS